ncbi:hypothetical protein DENSPDRAFT_836500 [Dentipellis sp. KUC8613]|nr:hypothetical protein DENSPDRAFT_836500 [Dentipellis sp. KUC8613]
MPRLRQCVFLNVGAARFATKKSAWGPLSKTYLVISPVCMSRILRFHGNVRMHAPSLAPLLLFVLTATVLRILDVCKTPLSAVLLCNLDRDSITWIPPRQATRMHFKYDLHDGEYSIPWITRIPCALATLWSVVARLRLYGVKICP